MKNLFMEKFLVSYSCGKDSTLALYRMLQQNHQAVGLLITINQATQVSWFHLVPRIVIQKIADSLKIPVYFIESTGAQNYLDTYEETLKRASAETNAKICVFGDIDIQEHRDWCTERTNKVGMESIFPLWQEDRESLTHEFIDLGFEAIIKVVNTEFLPKDLLGQKLTKELVTQIKESGADPCGENGEYHTIVVDGPIFDKKVAIKHIEISEYEQYRILNIT